MKGRWGMAGVGGLRGEGRRRRRGEADAGRGGERGMHLSEMKPGAAPHHREAAATIWQRGADGQAQSSCHINHSITPHKRFCIVLYVLQSTRTE